MDYLKQGAEAMRELLDWMERLIPGMRIIPDETPNMFKMVRGAGQMNFDMPGLWRAVQGCADDLERNAAAWLIEELSHNAGPAVHARTVPELMSALSSVGGTLEATSSSDFIMFVGGERRTIPRSAFVAQLWGIEDEEERHHILKGWMQQLSGRKVDDPRQHVRPMFLTPARDRQKATLVADLEAQTGLVATFEHDVTREIPGLQSVSGGGAEERRQTAPEPLPSGRSRSARSTASA